MNKLKEKFLDFLPVISLVVWGIINIYFALFYTQSNYNLINISVNIIGASLFWLSIKYNNKWLKHKHKTRTNND